jgi:LruC domain-containing protein
MKIFFLYMILAPFMFVAPLPRAIAGDEFENCPHQAFLIQTPNTSVINYGLDLATGSYSVLSDDMGTTKINAVGFNNQDNYLYGWDYGAQSLAQIGSDHQAVALNVTGGINKPFYVGDVAVFDNAWYGYRPSYGLYRIDLNDASAVLVLEKIATSQHMGNPKLTDMAFHPSDGYIYAVDNDGYLLKIDPSNGDTSNLGQVLNEQTLGFNFVFGAQYFDVNGHLYLSNNGNGYLYRVKVNEPSAVFFAYGPSSNSNDGARCALAGIETSELVDFADAPDSYGSSIAAAGARHVITELYLGDKVDAEADAFVYPLSDDTSDNSDDDDGITFPTGFEITQQSLIIAKSSTSSGYLNAWIDWDQDGEFEADEQVVQGLALTQGSNLINISVPVWAQPGDTWARFRLSHLPELSPIGGVSSGEVEDYTITVTEPGVTLVHYPSAGTYTTFAYEDLYPEQGDFDMNDVMMNVRFTQYLLNGQVIRIKMQGLLAAMGASYHNGFAIQLVNIASSKIKKDSIRLTINNVVQNGEILETDPNHSVLIVSEDLWSVAQPGETGCYYFRTETGCGTSTRPTWSLTVPFIDPVNEAQMPSLPYDPFIFAAAGRYHGDFLSSLLGTQPGRQFEVHLKNKAPTTSFASQIFGQGDDNSDSALARYFQSSNGMPWALEIPTNWLHPKENVNLLQAYPQFAGFSADQTGQTNRLWYQQTHADPLAIYQD